MGIFVHWGRSELKILLGIALMGGLTLGSSEMSFASGKPRFAKPAVMLTLLHTNDLHSHFRPDTTELNLGGVARLKTAIQQIRSLTPNTLLVDAGDWSEGNIYYNLNGGAETLRMMNHLGYDIAVVGNHDWINGPGVLLDSLKASTPRLSFISANLEIQDSEDFGRSAEFRQKILPYVIREIGGVKVAFIGLSTYEMIYDKFAAPAKVLNPFEIAKSLSSQLKRTVDAVIVVSHNNLENNQKVLREAPDVDLVISGHQHVKLTKPIEVAQENGKVGWVVEAEKWGHYLGRVDLKIGSGGLELLQYQLIQMDSSIPSDPETLARVEQLENKLESKYGPIFHDHVADCEVEVERSGVENRMGNLLTDAYLDATHADVAMESIQFVYGELHRGQIRSVDVFNANPAVFNPTTDKAWTLKTIPIYGKTLKWLLYTAYASKKLSSYGLLSISGMSFNYDPLFHSSRNPGTVDPVDELSPFNSILSAEQQSYLDDQALPVVQNILIQGKPLDPKATYLVATGGGLIEAIEFLNTHVMNIIPMDEMKDLGVENWRVVTDYIRNKKVLTPENTPVGNRIRTLKSDLGVYLDDIKLESRLKRQGVLQAKITVTVKNYGQEDSLDPASSVGSTLRIMTNLNGTNLAIDPKWLKLGNVYPIPKLTPGESKILTWDIEVPIRHISQGLYSVTAVIESEDSEVNSTNNEATRWFRMIQ